MNLLQDPYPILGVKLSEENCTKIDLSPKNNNLDSINFQDEVQFSKFIKNQLEFNKVDFGIGGYLEERNIYRRGELFKSNVEEYRNIHLGIDIWGKDQTPIYNTLDGELIVAHDNAGNADYGPTMILKYFSEHTDFYVLYGHLSRSSLSRYKIGDQIKRGERLGEFGSHEVNGNWPPHVHVQLIRALPPEAKDFPGVCSQNEVDHWKKECPNPEFIIA